MAAVQRENVIDARVGERLGQQLSTGDRHRSHPFLFVSRVTSRRCPDHIEVA